MTRRNIDFISSITSAARHWLWRLVRPFRETTTLTATLPPALPLRYAPLKATQTRRHGIGPKWGSPFKNMDAFICKNIGQVDDGVRIEQKRNTDGTLYFRASTTITSILGSDPALTQGPTLEGFGTTE